MKKFLFLAVFCISYSFAIVSIEPKEIGERKPGISGESGVSFEMDKGNTDMLSSSISARVQIDRVDSLSFATLSYEYATNKGEKSKDRAFLHLRHLNKINEDNVFESFAQIQRDKFKDQQLRIIAGIGDRYRFYFSNSGKAYFGAGFFYDREKFEDDGRKDYFRGNFYLSFNKKLNSSVKTSLISYYQPKLDKLSDFESVTSLEFDVKLTQKLNLVLLMKYDYDSTPAPNIKRYDFSQKIGIIYKF